MDICKRIRYNGTIDKRKCR